MPKNILQSRFKFEKVCAYRVLCISCLINRVWVQYPVTNSLETSWSVFFGDRELQGTLTTQQKVVQHRFFMFSPISQLAVLPAAHADLPQWASGSAPARPPPGRFSQPKAPPTLPSPEAAAPAAGLQAFFSAPRPPIDIHLMSGSYIRSIVECFFAGRSQLCPLSPLTPPGGGIGQNGHDPHALPQPWLKDSGKCFRRCGSRPSPWSEKILIRAFFLHGTGKQDSVLFTDSKILRIAGSLLSFHGKVFSNNCYE